MSITLQNINLERESFKEIYSEIGISQGIDVIIQNLSCQSVLIIKSDTMPTEDSVNGFVIKPDAKYPLEVTGYTGKLWAIGDGPIQVDFNAPVNLKPLASTLAMTI